MADKYYSSRDAGMRLRDTVCMYKGSPCYINEVSSDNTTASVCMLPLKTNGKHVTVDYTSPDFDYSTFPLGYMNYKKEAIYLGRRIGNSQKQGLSSSNIYILNETTQDRRTVSNNILLSSSFYDMITNNYPSLDKAINLLNEVDTHSVAISRDVAISHQFLGIGVEYRGQRVAYSKRGQSLFTMSQRKGLNAVRKVLIDRGIQV